MIEIGLSLGILYSENRTLGIKDLHLHGKARIFLFSGSRDIWSQTSGRRRE